MAHLLLWMGVLVLGYCGFVLSRASIYQAYESWLFDQARQAPPASSPGPGGGGTPAPVPPAVPAAPRSAEVPPPAPGTPLGRIEIPRLGVAAMICEGDDDPTLSKAVGHLPGTALPGQPGNVVLAGHRDTFFRGLRNVRKDDAITLTTLDGEQRYSVESTAVVEPTYVEALAPSATPLLTLVTCYPFRYVGHAPKRFIVRARKWTGEQAETVVKREQPEQAVPVARVGQSEQPVLVAGVGQSEQAVPVALGEQPEQPKPVARRSGREHAARARPAASLRSGGRGHRLSRSAGHQLSQTAGDQPPQAGGRQLSDTSGDHFSQTDKRRSRKSLRESLAFFPRLGKKIVSR